MASFDGQSHQRIYSHIPLGCHEGPPMQFNMMSVPLPNLPSFIPIPTTPETVMVKSAPLLPIVSNSPAGERFPVDMPRDVYEAVVNDEIFNSVEDMISTCSRCQHKNAIVDLKWKHAKNKLKNIDKFISILSKQVEFNLTPSQSTAAAAAAGQTIPQNLMCPSQPPHEVYNLKSNLSANAQEFRPIQQNQKQANLHQEDHHSQQPHQHHSHLPQQQPPPLHHSHHQHHQQQHHHHYHLHPQQQQQQQQQLQQLQQQQHLHQQQHAAAVTTSNNNNNVNVNDDNNNNNNNNSNNNNNNNNNNNSNDSRSSSSRSSNNNNHNHNDDDDDVKLRMSSSEPLDANDLNTLESGIDSGVHDSGVSDSGITDPPLNDSAPERYAPNDDQCKDCESDSLKNSEKDLKKKTKRKRTNKKPPKSDDGSTDNLLCDGSNDLNEFTNLNSSPSNTLLYNNSNASANSMARNSSSLAAISQLNDKTVVHHRSAVGGGGGGKTQRQATSKSHSHRSADRTPNTRARHGRDEMASTTNAVEKRNGTEHDRSTINDRTTTSGGRSASSRTLPVSVTSGLRNNYDSYEPAGSRGASTNRHNNGSGSTHPHSKKCNMAVGGGGKAYWHVVKEMDGNLFSVDKEYSLAHCVAEDLRMSAGIAVQFKREFGSVAELLDQRKKVGEVAVLPNGNRFIFYLITKQLSNGKPTLDSMKCVLHKLREECVKRDVKKLAMPRIGCGLDRLNWRDVREQLGEVFYQKDIEIVVYNFREDEDISDSTTHMKSRPLPRAPHVKYRADCTLSDIEPETAVVLFGTSTGYLDKTCQDVQTKHAFQKHYLDSCRKTPIGDLIEIPIPPGHYIIYVLMVRERETDALSFKNLQSCVKILNDKVKTRNFIYVAFEAINDVEDPIITEKILTVFRNCIHFHVEIHVCNSQQSLPSSNSTSWNSNSSKFPNNRRL